MGHAVGVAMVWSVVLFPVLGCAQQGAARRGMREMSEITMTLVGERPGRPPIVRLLVDVKLSNSSAATRWFLIPSNVGGAPGSGVDKLERLSAGPVRFGRLLGTGGFYAVSLRPQARLSIKSLEVAWWNDGGVRTPPAIEIRVADDVMLGGESISTWFEGDVAVAGEIEVDAPTAAHTSSKRTAGDVEVAVAPVGERRAIVTMKPTGR